MTRMAERDTVVLLHGMGRTRASLLVLQMHLQLHGFATTNFPYRTSTTTLDGITRALRKHIDEAVSGDRYHLVGHSLGNIIIRNAGKSGYPQGLGRIVMIAPPNHPAKLAVALRDSDLYQWLTGDCGRKLGDDAFYRDLPVPDVEFGIISGDKGQSVTFDEPNDGIVTVESTKLSTMTDHVQVSNVHTFIMNAVATRAQCVHFLRHGRFFR
jgi:triacylglycerol lipase